MKIQRRLEDYVYGIWYLKKPRRPEKSEEPKTRETPNYIPDEDGLENAILF